MTEQSAESEVTLRRSYERNSLLMKANIRLVATDQVIEARMRNLSVGGVMAEADIDVLIGENIQIELRNIGWTPGKVAWKERGHFGIAFEHPIDAKAVLMQVRRKKSEMPLYLKRLNQKANSF